MTHVDTAPAMSETARPGFTATGGYVEWGAVLAGAVLASALSFVLLTFGIAIGLSAASPWPSSGLPAKGLAALAVLWVMAQQIGTFMIGGYVAGRLRSRWQSASQDEVEFRDGLHGGLVWAVGVVIGAVLLMATAGAAARTGAEIAGRTVASAASNPTDAIIDTMLRPMVVAQAGTTSPQPGAGSSGAPARTTAAASEPPPASSTTTAEARAEVTRILAAAVASGSLAGQNRAYLAQLVSRRTGLSQAEAEQRVDAAVTSAREAADKAKRAAILTGFVTAASLLISFGAAWWAALRGGNHRDNAVPARFPVQFPRRG